MVRRSSRARRRPPPTTDKITVWTIQKAEYYQPGQALTCDECYDSSYAEAYQWMVAEMKRRIGPPPHPGAFPIWVWLQYDGAQKPRPDLRESGWFERGTRCVRLECRVDPNALLPSEFELWHYVLNKWYLPSSRAESQAAKDHCRWDSTPEGRSRIEASWHRIFDLDWTAEGIKRPREECCIQGTLWQLMPEDVMHRQEFVAR